MKTLTLPLVSAAILAAASFGAQAQQDKQLNDNGQSGGQQQERRGEKQGEKQGGDRDQMKAQQSQQGDRDQMRGKEHDNKSADQMRDQDRDKNKSAAEKRDQDRDKNKSADQMRDQDRDKNKSADQNRDQHRDQDRKSADQDKGGGGGKQAAHVEIKAEQKTVIKQTFVKENIRPERVNVQVRVGIAIPQTVVLHTVSQPILEVYPSYSRYKLVLVDDNTILIVDPVDWTIVDIIEV